MFSMIKGKIDERKEVKKRTKEVKYEIFTGRKKLNFLVKLLFIITKNFKLLIRSKFSALIFLLGPLLIIFLVSLAFNTSSLYDLNIAVYSDSYTELSEQIIGTLQDNQYNVIKLGSLEECIDAVKFSNFQVCAEFPGDMSLGENSENNVIKLYVDTSRINIASLISSQMNAKVESESTELSKGLISQIVNVLNIVNTEVSSAKLISTDLVQTSIDSHTKIGNVKENLDTIEFNTTTIDWDLMNSYITNLSGSTKNDLRDLIEESELNFNAMKAGTTTASLTINNVKEIVDTLRTTLADTKSDIKSIDNSLNTMNNNVRTLEVTDTDTLVNPVTTVIEPLTSSNNYLAYLLPTLLIMVIMLVALLMSSSTVLQEKVANAHFRNIITPTSESLFIFGNFLSNLIIIIFQIVIILGVIYYFLHTQIALATLGYMALVLILTAILFIALGMSIGYVFNTKQTVTLAALSTGLILLFFSNTLLPLETLSRSTRQVIMYNPFVIGESLLKKLMLFNVSFADVSLMFYILIGMAVGLFFITLIISSIYSKLTKL